MTTEKQGRPPFRRVGIEWKPRAVFLALGIAVLAAADQVIDAQGFSVWLRAAIGVPLLTFALACFAVVVGVTARQIPAFRRVALGLFLLALALVALVLLVE